jgi:EAL domain-containing protein (putative c-di-GMP-specific phosphodiesterase class I)/GGDEF domain-containing protein
VLTAAGATTYAWNIAADRIAWGPNAAEVLGIPHIGSVSTGEALDAAIETETGATRLEAMGGAGGRDGGSGVPFRMRYALRVRADRLTMVEEMGRWYADARGRPVLATGMLRAAPPSGGEADLTAGLKARATLLARIMDDVVEAQRSRRVVTLAVGSFVNADDSSARPEDSLDALLSEAGRRVRPIMRRRDHFAIYGPNRFALALASCPQAEADAAARRILALVRGGPSDPALPALRLGLACAPGHAVDAPELLHRAEQALGCVPAGRPGFSLYRAGAGPAARAGTPPQDVIDALNGRQVHLAHEPVVEAARRQPVFIAARPRLGRGVARGPAADLASCLEPDGLSILVDGRALELAAAHLAAEPRDRMAIAVSPGTLKDGEWLGMLAAHLGAHPGIESRLVIDVPEAALGDTSVRGRLDAMKALGVAVMVSGYGAGHASFKQLQGLPVDMLKIGGPAIQALSQWVEARHLVRGLIDLAHHLGTVVIAEWVDDEATARLLSGWGVDCLQGAVASARATAARHDPERPGRKAASG